MSYQAEAAAIREHWADNWTDTPTAYENAPFNPPDGPWARLTILNAKAFQADLGDSPRYRHPGTVIVQLFTPHGTGDGQARTLGDAAAALFRGRTIGGVVFRTPSVIPQGSDGTWYQVNMVADYYRDTIY